METVLDRLLRHQRDEGERERQMETVLDRQFRHQRDEGRIERQTETVLDGLVRHQRDMGREGETERDRWRQCVRQTGSRWGGQPAI